MGVRQSYIYGLSYPSRSITPVLSLPIYASSILIEVTSCAAPEAVHVTLVAPTVLLLNDTNIISKGNHVGHQHT
jgi:hypothetical protein